MKSYISALVLLLTLVYLNSCSSSGGSGSSTDSVADANSSAETTSSDDSSTDTSSSDSSDSTTTNTADNSSTSTDSETSSTASSDSTESADSESDTDEADNSQSTSSDSSSASESSSATGSESTDSSDSATEESDSSESADSGSESSDESEAAEELLVIKVENNSLTVNNETVTLTTVDDEGTVTLSADIEDFTVTDADGNSVAWSFDDEGNITVVLPDDYADSTYTVSFTTDGRDYELDAAIAEDGSVATTGTSSDSDVTLVLNLQTGHVTLADLDAVALDDDGNFVISTLNSEGEYELSSAIDSISAVDYEGDALTVSIDPITGDLVVDENADFPVTITVISGGTVTKIVTDSESNVTAATGSYLAASTEDGTLSLGDTSITVATFNEENGSYTQSETVTISAVDQNGNTVTVTVDPETGNLVSQSDSSSPLTITVEDSESEDLYTFTVNNSGSVTTASAVYTVADLTNGTISYSGTTLTIATPSETDGFTAETTYSITVYDQNGDTVEVSIDSETGNIISTEEIESSFTLVVSDNDTTYTFSVDSTGKISSLLTEDTVAVLTEGRLEVTESITLDISEEVTSNGTTSWQLADGVVITATDESGNTVSVSVDPETGNIVSDSATDGAVILTVTTDDDTSYTVTVSETGQIDEEAEVSASYTFDTTEVTVDTNDITSITAVDDEGNTIAGTLSYDDAGDILFVPADGSDIPAALVIQTEEGSYTFDITEEYELSEPTYLAASQDGGNSTGSGVSTTDDSSVSAENGSVVIDVDDNGTVNIGGGEADLSDAQSVEIVVTDSEGNTIYGETSVDEDGNYTFTPDTTTSLEGGESYTVTVVADGVSYEETVIISVDDTAEENSKFASAGGFATGSFDLSDLLTDDGEVIFGWDFDDADDFNFSISDVPAGATVLITGYGIYDIEGHEDEVYYQRWTSGEAVKDYDITGYGAITVDPTDSSIMKEDGTYYDFTTTYFEIVILDSEGNDITATCGAALSITADTTVTTENSESTSSQSDNSKSNGKSSNSSSQRGKSNDSRNEKSLGNGNAWWKNQ